MLIIYNKKYVQSNSGNMAGVGINHLSFKSSILEQLKEKLVTLFRI
jgi:hypothetical protein